MATPVQCGKILLSLDDEAFRQGYENGRRYYCEDCQHEPHKVTTLTATDLLVRIAARYENGHWEHGGIPWHLPLSYTVFYALP